MADIHTVNNVVKGIDNLSHNGWQSQLEHQPAYRHSPQFRVFFIVHNLIFYLLLLNFKIEISVGIGLVT